MSRHLLSAALVVTTLAAAPATAVAAEQPAPSNPNGLGLSVSTLAGSGVTYRRWLDNGLGFQVAGVPFMGMKDDGSLGGFYNIGAQVMYAPLRFDNVSFYGMLGAGVGNNLYAGRSDAGIAPGVGMDWSLSPNFALVAALGYTLSMTQTASPRRTTYGLSPGFTVGGLVCF
ncbi:hypothetical protein D3C86_881530 [compost metagenome]